MHIVLVFSEDRSSSFPNKVPKLEIAIPNFLAVQSRMLQERNLAASIVSSRC